MNLHKKDQVFAYQIRELRQYCNHLDEKIAMYEEQGRNPERLKENKARALSTIAELQQYQTINGREIAP
ncbi:MAG TPA: hypothetical protein VJ964_03195 [Balneolaceae bacterium]|nr:hypothetical protein [Balneolaceae bacterium]